MNKKLILVSALVLAAALIRLLPHAPNFTPIGAMALFAGALISNRLLAFLIPALAMVISDACLGFAGWRFAEQTIVVYGVFMLTTWLGMSLRNNQSVIKITGTSIAASVLFFVVTNFAVWFGGFYHTPALYTLDFMGLVNCFIAAIPFAGATFASDLVYSALLFGSFYLIRINVPSLVKENN